MEPILTAAEMEAQFPAEWILVENPQTSDFLEVQNGLVRWHSKDRDEVYRKAVEFRPQRFAILYTGQIPDDAQRALLSSGNGKASSAAWLITISRRC